MKRRFGFAAYSGFRANNSGFRAYGKPIRTKHSDIFSVVSLKHGTGCTHMAIAIANYISRMHRGERVALVIRKEDADSDYVRNHVSSKVDVLINGDRKTEEYQLRVYDIGVVSINGEPIDILDDRSSDTVGQRFVMCNDNEEYYYILDKFTRSNVRAVGFVYLFGRIPRQSMRRVEDIMIDYSFNFVPPFQIDKLEEVSGLMGMYIGG